MEQDEQFFIVHKKKVDEPKQEQQGEPDISPLSIQDLEKIKQRNILRLSVKSELTESLRFQSENIINKQESSASLVQSVTCPICLLILQTPYYECLECSNNFCVQCLTDWWSKNPQQCIFKCEAPDFKFIKRSNTHNALLQVLKVKCQKCEKQYSVSQIYSHLSKQCPEVEQLCEYCQKKIKRGKIQTHLNQCEYKPVKCLFCVKQFISKDHKQHEFTCLQRTVSCNYPNCEEKQIRLKDKQLHVQNCLYAPINCQWCQTALIKKDFQQHQTNCQYRRLLCEWCQKQYNCRQIFDHQISCELRKEMCLLCRANILEKDMKEHKVECVYDNLVTIKQINNKLVVDNIRLREKVALLQEIMEESVSNRESSTIRLLKQMKNQDRKAFEKDLNRIDYSVKSVEKLKKQQFGEHMKKPHWIQSWCPICKVLEKKFKDMMDPLLNSRKQIMDKLEELDRFNFTPK